MGESRRNKLPRKLAGRIDRQRTAIALYLRSHGPTYGAVIASELSMTLEHFWVAISNDFRFRIMHGGWGLSRIGREWVAAQQGGAPAPIDPASQSDTPRSFGAPGVV